MTSSKRGAAFSIEEDKLLVMAYLDVSQNPIIGINQSRDRLWSRVAATYNEQLAGNSTEPRTTKALQCRWFNINKIVQNFSSCVSQVELSRPSGASEKDILDQAKALFKQSTGSTWRLDHVWSLLKDQEKFRSSNAILPNFIPNRGNIDSSQSDYSPNTESPTPDSGGLSGFAINLDEDNPSGGSSQRPIGIKKAKAKRKATEEHLKDISTMAKCTEKMVTVMENAEVHRQQLIAVEKQRNAIMAFKEENKILRMNPMCVDESVRAYLIKEQQKIWQKRMETGDGSDGTSTPFGQFFGGTSPSGSDLPPY
ncbi:uncharacterized protein [Primulina eburnea]|uniref:uncharacterized protein n=1 Tax=Primulina eburnea TaxID=1245227 RepID=UPI003C6C15FF